MRAAKPVTCAKKPSQEPGSALKKPPFKHQATSTNKPVTYKEPERGNMSVTGYQPPVTNQVTNTATGLDALKDAIWGSGIEIPAKLNHEPSMDNLRFAFVGDEAKKDEPVMVKQASYVTDNETEQKRDIATEDFDEKFETEMTLGGEVGDFEETDWDKEESTSTDQVHKIQAIVESVYPEFNDLSTKSETGFQPHLTLGQCQAEEVKNFIQGLQVRRKSQLQI